MYSWKGSTTEPLHIALYKYYSGNLDTLHTKQQLYSQLLVRNVIGVFITRNTTHTLVLIHRTGPPRLAGAGTEALT